MHGECKSPQNLLGNRLMEILQVQNEVLLLKGVPGFFFRSDAPRVHHEKAMA